MAWRNQFLRNTLGNSLENTHHLTMTILQYLLQVCYFNLRLKLFSHFPFSPSPLIKDNIFLLTKHKQGTIFPPLPDYLISWLCLNLSTLSYTALQRPSCFAWETARVFVDGLIILLLEYCHLHFSSSCCLQSFCYSHPKHYCYFSALHFAYVSSSTFLSFYHLTALNISTFLKALKPATR